MAWSFRLKGELSKALSAFFITLPGREGLKNLTET